MTSWRFDVLVNLILRSATKNKIAYCGYHVRMIPFIQMTVEHTVTAVFVAAVA